MIDDHRSILWGLERLIESGSPAMKVVGSAENVTAALKTLDAAQPDVILLDIDLGTENGIDGIPKLTAISKARISGADRRARSRLRTTGRCWPGRVVWWRRSRLRRPS